MNHKPDSQLTLNQLDSTSVEYLAPDIFFIGGEIHIYSLDQLWRVSIKQRFEVLTQHMAPLAEL